MTPNANHSRSFPSTEDQRIAVNLTVIADALELEHVDKIVPSAEGNKYTTKMAELIVENVIIALRQRASQLRYGAFGPIGQEETA